MTEKMLKKAKEDFEQKLAEDFYHLHLYKSIRDDLVKAFEEAIRNNVPVGNFPMWPIHEDDGGYGELSKAVSEDAVFCWDEDV